MVGLSFLSSFSDLHRVWLYARARLAGRVVAEYAGGRHGLDAILRSEEAEENDKPEADQMGVKKFREGHLILLMVFLSPT